MERLYILIQCFQYADNSPYMAETKLAYGGCFWCLACGWCSTSKVLTKYGPSISRDLSVCYFILIISECLLIVVASVVYFWDGGAKTLSSESFN